VRAAKTCEQIVNELVNEDVSQCCFCKEKYGSEACRECPARDFPMPDEVEDDLSEDS
jgi:hypothetical protein